MARDKATMKPVWFRAPEDLVKWIEQRAAALTVLVSAFIRMKLIEAKDEGR
jgi:hypothetical protein